MTSTIHTFRQLLRSCPINSTKHELLFYCNSSGWKSLSILERKLFYYLFIFFNGGYHTDGHLLCFQVSCNVSANSFIPYYHKPPFLTDKYKFGNKFMPMTGYPKVRFVGLRAVALVDRIEIVDCNLMFTKWSTVIHGDAPSKHRNPLHWHCILERKHIHNRQWKECCTIECNSNTFWNNGSYQLCGVIHFTLF
jgi:hypothetical protein